MLNFGDLEIEQKKDRRGQLNLALGRRIKGFEVIKIKLRPRLFRGKS